MILKNYFEIEILQDSLEQNVTQYCFRVISYLFYKKFIVGTNWGSKFLQVSRSETVRVHSGVKFTVYFLLLKTCQTFSLFIYLLIPKVSFCSVLGKNSKSFLHLFEIYCYCVSEVFFYSVFYLFRVLHQIMKLELTAEETKTLVVLHNIDPIINSIYLRF